MPCARMNACALTMRCKCSSLPMGTAPAVMYDSVASACSMLLPPMLMRVVLSGCQLRAHAGDGGAYLLRRGAADVVARGNRAFQRQHGEHVVADQRREGAQLVQRHLGQVDFQVVAGAHRTRHGFVRVTEG